MYFADDALYPENMQPLIITAAPYGPTWLPGDAPDIAVTWDEQVQAAVFTFAIPQPGTFRRTSSITTIYWNA